MAVDPLAAIQIVLVTEGCRDPAIDLGGCECKEEKHAERAECPAWRVGMDCRAYLDTQDNALVKTREGKTPTWFHLIQLKGTFVLEEIDTLKYASQKHAMAFRSSCHRIEIPGEPAMVVAEDEWISKQAPKVASKGWLDRVATRFGTEAIVEAGSIALYRIRMPKVATGPLA